MSTATRWPFIGRRAELERFADALDDQQCDAVLVTGAAGVGKSRLAQECLEYAQARGHETTYLRATESAAAVPLSVLGPLLPSEVDLTDAHGLFAAVRDRVRERGTTGRVVLGIDDVDLLDTTSRALLAFLLADGAVFVVATQRSDAVPDALEARQREGRALRLTLAEMDRLGVETLLHLALGGPVAAEATQALWEASLGNVLYLRELVLRAQTDHTLSQVDGVWRLAGQLAASAGVVELVGRRLRDLEPAQRAVLELLALCEPIGVDELLRHADLGALTDLEERGLITLHDRGRRQEITLGHPLHAKVLQESMPRLRIRAVLLGQIERVVAHGARRRSDPMLLASWRLDATGTADPQLLIQAARLARYTFDLPRTQRLAEAVLRQGADPAATELLAEALAGQGRFFEAEEAWAAADLRTSGRALNLHFGLSQPAHAYAPDDADLHARLGGPIPADTTDPELLLEAGRLTDAVSAARAAMVAYEQADDRGGLTHPAHHQLTISRALTDLGRLADAEEAVRLGLALARVENVVSALPGLLGQSGWIALATGKIRTAAGCFRSGLGALAGYQHPGIQTSLDAAVTLTAALLGEPADSPDPRAGAWQLARAGQVTEAAHLLSATALSTSDSGRRLCAAELLHDALRLAPTPDLARALLPLVSTMDGELAAARAAHAAAVLSGDPAAYDSAAQCFRDLGFALLAAELLLHAAERLTGRHRAATARRTQAKALLEFCEGATPPTLRLTAAPDPLSAREREVALLAAAGNTSRQIAEQLSLSVRTIDNHLQNIYLKLGVSQRADLGPILGGGA